jgi:hypothetical protein
MRNKRIKNKQLKRRVLNDCKHYPSPLLLSWLAQAADWLTPTSGNLHALP